MFYQTNGHIKKEASTRGRTENASAALRPRTRALYANHWSEVGIRRA